MNYDINYEDEKFKNVENEKNQQLNSINETYNNMINQSDTYYQNQINAAKEYANQQKEMQQANTDLAIEQINNQKEDAKQDYTKEQKASYVDWQKQSNAYGTNAEQIAASGLQNSGYSESSQVAMYNTYQNRVSTARESYNKAIRDYDMAIKDAQLQNSSALAEIAYKALQTELELSLQGFEYKNTLLLDQVNKQQEINNTYYTRYQDVLNQMNTENALKENIRQYEQNLAYQKEQDALAQQNWEKEYALSQQKAKSSGSKSGSSITLTDTAKKNSNNKTIAQRLNATGKSMLAAAEMAGQQEESVNDLQMKTIKANWNQNKDVNMLVAYMKEQGFTDGQVAYVEKQLGIS